MFSGCFRAARRARRRRARPSARRVKSFDDGGLAHGQHGVTGWMAVAVEGWRERRRQGYNTNNASRNNTLRRFPPDREPEIATTTMLPPFALLLASSGEVTSRRRIIESAAVATSFAIFPSLPSNANDDLYLAQPMGIKNGKSDESVKPSAPLEYLLPAAR